MSCDTLEEFNDVITRVCVVDEVNFINDFIYEELEFKDCKEFTSVLKQENKIDRKLYNKSFVQRFLIMFAGAMNNFILCFVLLLISAFIYGSVSSKPVVSSVSEEYPAFVAGIQSGDTILKINGDVLKYECF